MASLPDKETTGLSVDEWTMLTKHLFYEMSRHKIRSVTLERDGKKANIIIDMEPKPTKARNKSVAKRSGRRKKRSGSK